MTSLSLFPRALALSAYSAVSGSRMTLCLAISCRALFACRSPPLLSLCLTVLPLEAGIGQAPHIAANDASERSLPGLSPAATASLAALTGPHPYIASSAGQFSSRDASIASSMSSAASRAAAHRSASAPSAAPSAPSARTEGSSSISLGPAIPRNLDLSPSGAVVSSDLAVLIAEVRAFTAPERAASMQRTPSTHPSWLLGVPSLEPDIAARAALSASASSHFPCPGRLLCALAGESASRTGIPSDARCLVRPAP